MANSTRSSSNEENNFAGMRRLCGHNIPAVLNTSHSQKNPERRYSCCRYRFTGNDCGFWEWHDEELDSYYKLCFLRMYAERDQPLRNHIKEPHIEVEEDNNGEEYSAVNADLLSLMKSMNSTLKNLEYQIRIIYVVFAFIVLMFIISKD